MFRAFVAFSVLTGLLSCEPEAADESTPVRGLKTHLVEETEQVTIRRFPTVLEPSELNTLSFEVGGKLGEMRIAVGQRIEEGDVVASLDPTSLQLQVDNARAGVDQARASSENAADTLARQEELLSRGSVTRVAVDNARAEAEAKAAALTQAEKALETAEENLNNAVLRSPFGAIVNSVAVESFATVGVGTPIATLYRPDAFEVAFTANFEVASELVVGKPAKVRLADRPDIVLDAVVSELGSRADTVSSFPVVLTLTSTDPVMKAGMAAEASMEFPLPRQAGFVVPVTVAIMDGQLARNGGPREPSALGVYVFDPETSTVKRRTVMVGGVRENSLIIIEGLQAGDRVASAGVSFLRDGQEVKLLPDAD